MSQFQPIEYYISVMFVSECTATSAGTQLASIKIAYMGTYILSHSNGH